MNFLEFRATLQRTAELEAEIRRALANETAESPIWGEVLDDIARQCNELAKAYCAAASFAGITVEQANDLSREQSVWNMRAKTIRELLDDWGPT